MDLLARTASASVCEFNWSAVKRIETDNRCMDSATTCKLSNVAAQYHVEQALINRNKDSLPTLDDVLVKMLQEAEDDAPLPILNAL